MNNKFVTFGLDDLKNNDSKADDVKMKNVWIERHHQNKRLYDITTRLHHYDITTICNEIISNGEICNCDINKLK